jgi:hypothetical protein
LYHSQEICPRTTWNFFMFLSSLARYSENLGEIKRTRPQNRTNSTVEPNRMRRHPVKMG